MLLPVTMANAMTTTGTPGMAMCAGEVAFAYLCRQPAVDLP